mmetsp:Transcript_16080/g.37284  ORF Transcript_16080/g.37284 Transcript_16080/m.37284 type:complete len:201 (+) Transcript_16080:1594-2196(+)
MSMYARITTLTAPTCTNLNTSRCTTTEIITTIITTTTAEETTTTTGTTAAAAAAVAVKASTATRKHNNRRTICTSSLIVPNTSMNMVNSTSLALTVDLITTPSRLVFSLMRTASTTSERLCLCRRYLVMVTVMNLSSIFLTNVSPVMVLNSLKMTRIVTKKCTWDRVSMEIMLKLQTRNSMMLLVCVLLFSNAVLSVTST